MNPDETYPNESPNDTGEDGGQNPEDVSETGADESE